jgi:hypothetical protein
MRRGFLVITTTRSHPMAYNKTLVLSAFACGDGYDPQFATVDITPADVERIEEVSALCASQRLMLAVMNREVALATFGAIDEDGGSAFESEHRVNCWELHVSGKDLWWRGEFKHSDDGIETHMISLQTLREAMAGAADTVYIRQGQIDPSFAEVVLEVA